MAIRRFENVDNDQALSPEEIALSELLGDAESIPVNLPDGQLGPSLRTNVIDDINVQDGVSVDLGDAEAAPGIELIGAETEIEPDHYINLAEGMDEQALTAIADEIIDMVEADSQSMSPWRDRLAKGMEVAGLTRTSQNELLFLGASDAVHPMVMESLVQFNARAQAEILPPGGPCKALIIGDEDDAVREQADRMEKHMNYQMTEEDEGYYDEMDKLLMYLPLAGSAFTKTYRDEALGYTTSRFVKGEDCIMPYSASGIANTSRFTLSDKIYINDLRKLIASGFYRDIEITEDGLTASDQLPVDEQLQTSYDDSNGTKGASKRMNEADSDAQHIRFESYINYILPDDTDDSGIARPYIITIDKTQRKVLSIYRNWRPDDARMRREKFVTEYKYLPGFGSHGFGVLHVLGGLASSCTGALRALLDSASFATLQGGFKSKETRLAGEVTLVPGQWTDCDLSAEELKNAFYTPPFHEPSPVLMALLEHMEQSGQRMLNTTENVVGDANNTGPVGTTVALIEQGTKVMTGIHRRLYRAQRNEFRIRARINADSMDEGQQLFYDDNDTNSYVTADDYTNRRVNIIPVSDPNIVSAAQRIAKQQGVLELSDSAPELYKQYDAHYGMLDALGVDNPDEYLRNPNQKHRCDAAGEGARIIAGKSVFVFPDQNHEAHLALHMLQLEYFKTLPEEQAMPLVMSMMEHMSKHEAYRLWNLQNQATGGQLPAPDLYSDDPKDEMPAAIELRVTEQASMFMQQLVAQAQSMQPPPKEDAEAKAKIDRDNAAFTEDEKRKQASWENEEARKEKSFVIDQQRAVVDDLASIDSEERKTNAKIDAGNKAAKSKMDNDRASSQAKSEQSSPAKKPGGGKTEITELREDVNDMMKMISGIMNFIQSQQPTPQQMPQGAENVNPAQP